MKLTWNFLIMRAAKLAGREPEQSVIVHTGPHGPWLTIKHSEHEADNIKTSQDPSVKRFFPLLGFIDPNRWRI